MLLSLRSHESRMRRRLALCDELCASLESLYRAARTLAGSRLGIGTGEIDRAIRKAPASSHTICAMIRDFADSLNRVVDLIEFDVVDEAGEASVSVDSPVAPVVRKVLLHAIDEHNRLRSWQQVSWIGLSFDGRRQLGFQWSDAMKCIQKNPRRAYPALRPMVLLARRIADEAMELLDPLTGPIAEERAGAFAITKKLRAQIDHIRSQVNRKCDALEGEMRAVQSAIVKAQSQTMSLVRNLTSIGQAPSP